MPSDSYTLTISSLGIAAAHAASHAVSGSDPIAISTTQVTAGTLPVIRGGTGAATLTGYVKGDGTNTMTASASVPVSDISGTLPANKGGTGAASLTGYVKGTGTAAMTANDKVPATDISGILPVLSGGTGVTTSTGTGSSVLSISPTLVTPILGTPVSGTLTNCTGLPISGTTGTLSADRLPVPTTTTLGGVKRNIGTSGQIVSGISSDGSLVFIDAPTGGTGTGGTVTSFSFTEANGFVGTVNTSTSTPTLSLKVSPVGILKGSSTGTVVAAVSGTDYAPATGSTAYAPASGSANYAPATGSTVYAPISGSANYAPATGSSNYSPTIGSASIITLGTITTGVWNGTTIAIANGGTGATTAANAVTNLTTIETRAATTITLVSSDSGKILKTTSGTAVSIVIPTGLPANFSVMIIQGAAGLITFSGSGTSIQSFGNLLKTAGLYAAASIIRVDTDVYNLSGNLS